MDSVYDARPASCGFLHSEICGSKLAYSSPQLIAVNHVLHRLPMPRHSPCALFRFTFRCFSTLIFPQSFGTLRSCELCSIMFLNFRSWLLLFFTRLLRFYSLMSLKRSFLIIFALHLLFSFQGTLFLSLSEQISEELFCSSQIYFERS